MLFTSYRSVTFSIRAATRSSILPSTRFLINSPIPQKTTIRMTSTAWSDKDGQFRRQKSTFRDFISNEPGAQFPPEKGRYHLYVSWACPWAHRTLITRKLKGLDKFIDITIVGWFLGDKGWAFDEPEPLYGFDHLSQLYKKANPDYDARYTVPVLWDKKTETIVNNESSEIIRMFNTAFNEQLDEEHRSIDIYPTKHQAEIDSINEWVYDGINNGVYKTGFATTQEAYDSHVYKVFEALDKAESLLKNSGGPFLLGADFTEADLRLYPTIVRFDPVYVQHFKCNLAMIRDGYPELHKWLRNLYWNNEAFKSTTNFEHIKFHYTKSHLKYNPFGITPAGPLPNILPLDRK